MNTIDIIQNLQRLETARDELQEALSIAQIELCSARRSSSFSDVSINCVPQELSTSVRVSGTTLHFADAAQDDAVLKWFGERPTDELRTCQSLFKIALEKCMNVMLAERMCLNVDGR
jgi:hypothetical protein